MLKSLVFLAAIASSGLAATAKYDFDIGWVQAAPDGFQQPVIGIDGKWPLPTIEATVGDRVIVDVNNKLGNESTGLHFHGIHQLGTNHMDGPAHGTQCPVPPGQSFTYDFTVDQSGTYWYHSHTGSQYPDGLRAPLIVHDKPEEDPYKNKYDEEYLLTVSDWYHAPVPTLLTQMFNTSNVQIRPPLPQAGLINEASNAVANTSLKSVPGKKYKVRVNMAALASVMLFFDQHKMEFIEIDGVHVEKTEAEQLYIAPAQRYSFIIEAKVDVTKNYAFSAVFDLNPDFRRPTAVFPINATGYLEYNPALGFPGPVTAQSWNLLDDFKLKVLGYPSPYVHQKVPTLYTALSAGDEAVNPVIYGAVNPYMIKKGQVVEFILNNLHLARHSFHFHGHHFQVCRRGLTGSGVANQTVDCSSSAMVRDTVVVNGNSTAVLRFKADNPGVWLLHCQLQWHKTIKVPPQHIDVCKAQCMPYEGNAAGNTANFTDLSGANFPPEDADDGAIYTARTCPATSTSSTAAPTSSTTVATTASITTTASSHATASTSTTEYTTSTLYTTKTLTATSCAPTVANCPHTPYGTTTVVPWTTTVRPVTQRPITNCPHTPHVVTTEVIPAYSTTTICSVTHATPSTTTPATTGGVSSTTTSALYSTRTHTVTSCPPELINCPSRVPYVTAAAGRNGEWHWGSGCGRGAAVL
ncbi:hypothetical protein VTK56DRAFT_2413 [Thermocarpiscus australiensis]